MTLLRKLCVAPVLLSLAGCFSHDAYYLNIATSPSGATVREDGGALTALDGFTGLRYNTSGLKQHQANGCFLIRGFTATWPSGAKASTGTIRWCDKSNTLMSVMIQRPADAPGLQADMDAASRQVQAELAAQKAAAAVAAQPQPTEQPSLRASDPINAAEVADIQLSSDCDIAEKQAAAQVDKMLAASKGRAPNICQNARYSRASAEIGLKLAQICEGRPGQAELQAAMINMRDEADATISGSCM